jgi:hypothetical protein
MVVVYGAASRAPAQLIFYVYSIPKRLVLIGLSAWELSVCFEDIVNYFYLSGTGFQARDFKAWERVLFYNPFINTPHIPFNFLLALKPTKSSRNNRRLCDLIDRNIPVKKFGYSRSQYHF